MSLSSRYKKRSEEVQAMREKLAYERATSSIEKLMQTDQFKLSAIALPENRMNVDAIIGATVKTVLDPKAMMMDTLRAKGFRPAEIRKLVHDLHLLYFKTDKNQAGLDLTYEEMTEPVANFLAEHQEVYNTLEPSNFH